MATVKSLIDEFLDRINQPRESSYVGATSPAARQYVSLFKFIGDELLKNPGSWSQLKRTYVFTTQTGVSLYQLPGDYWRLLPGTQWGVTNQIPLAGPLSNAQLAFQTYGVLVTGPFSGWQINGAQGYIYNTSPYTQRSAGYFQISPAGVDDTTQNVIAYGSKNYVWPTDWTASTAGFVVGSKVTGINNIYIATAITTGITGTTRPSVTTGSVVDGGVTWTVYNEPYPVTADTDICLFDDAIMIEGLRWAWYQSKKQDYKDLEREWRSTVRTSIARQNGTTMINAGYNANLYNEWPITPNGNWPF